jgi:hypothetical protein
MYSSPPLPLPLLYLLGRVAIPDGGLLVQGVDEQLLLVAGVLGRGLPGSNALGEGRGVLYMYMDVLVRNSRVARTCTPLSFFSQPSARVL